ncbi:MAG: hypothetical protein RR621_10065 [Lachnospiraceae bacterium]
MATNNEIHEFAVHWLEKYKSETTTERDVTDSFDIECVTLGFEMDCGKAFETALPNTNALNDADALYAIIDKIQDANLLGSAIFSKWRGITHWEESSLLAPKCRNWFITAFSRLEILTSNQEISTHRFQGQVQKIQIISNNICYGPCPKPGDEVEQHLTITADGCIEFLGYNYGNGDKPYRCGRTKNFNIGKDIAAHILTVIGNYFSDEYETVFTTDIGSWDMTITNAEGRTYLFSGSLCCDFEVDGIDLSDLIRDTLDMPDLFLFDGNDKSDSVNRIAIEYHRITKIKPKVPISDTLEYCTWDYTEQLVIDRASETLEHIQNIGTGCVISRKYYVKDGIANLLDDLDVDSLFENIIGNEPDVIVDPLETKDYQITVDFDVRSQLILCGTYDKNGLPEDFPELMESIWDFIRFYGMGEILDPSVYEKARRKIGEYIFCSVEFDESSKSYYYLTEDESLKIGDLVLVPVGKEANTSLAQIVDIEYFSKDNVPFPFEKVKSIICKCRDEDFVPDKLENIE